MFLTTYGPELYINRFDESDECDIIKINFIILAGWLKQRKQM